jgi:hypothetical protein
VHGRSAYFAGEKDVEKVKGIMARPKARYSMVVRNHVTGDRLKVELIDLPFLEGRRFRVRVHPVR